MEKRNDGIVRPEDMPAGLGNVSYRLNQLMIKNRRLEALMKNSHANRSIRLLEKTIDVLNYQIQNGMSRDELNQLICEIDKHLRLSNGN